MISLKDICKSFGEKVLFDKLNLDISDGEFVVFAGKSGCGKTTLLNIIGGLERPDSGTVLVDGKDIFKRNNIRKYFTETVGFLFQNFALVENETVIKNLEYVQKRFRSEKSSDEILEHLGLIDKRDTKVYKLSGGEQQRVAIARLMYKKCKIILADEPTGSLDSENASSVMKTLHQLNDSGKTIILVTHSERIIANEKRVINL